MNAFIQKNYSKEEVIDIKFENYGGYDTSLHYCYQTNQLWTINNGVFYNYEVELQK